VKLGDDSSSRFPLHLIPLEEGGERRKEEEEEGKAENERNSNEL